MINDSKALMTRIVSQDQGWSNDDTQLHRYAKQSQWQCVFVKRLCILNDPFREIRTNFCKVWKTNILMIY